MANQGIVKLDDARIGRMVPYVYDYIVFSPEDKPETIIFKSGGASGPTVATLTLTWVGNDVATITRT